MILVYSSAESPRLRYVLDLVGRECFAAPLLLCTDTAVFLTHDGPKLQYGGEREEKAAFYIPAVSLLFEKGLRAQETACFSAGEWPAFFPGKGEIPFDLFAGIFYLLSRYEEWLPFTPDQYGRFPPEASLAFRNGFLKRPLIDEWLLYFQQRIAAAFPGLVFIRRAFRFLPTYDIDMAWSYSGKGSVRNAGGYLRDLLRGNVDLLGQRKAVLSGKLPDPFDSFSFLDRLHKDYRLAPRYFFLLADRPGKLDKNTSPKDRRMRELVKEHAGRYDTGIHPSWRSGDENQRLIEEIATLTTLSGKPVTVSRQHYLRLAMPVTYRLLLAAGIRNDFSMGYGPLNGFRASCTGGFYWYDLETEIQTELLLTPFCFMDAAAFYGEKKGASSALEEMQTLLQAVRRVNGCMTTLWHNHFLGSSPEFAGWREAYEQLVHEACAQP